MRRTATAVTAALLLTLTGCSSGDAEPAKTVTATTTAPPQLSKAEQTRQCVDAVADVAAAASGEVPSEPTPAPCASLNDSEYLDAYMDGISQANRAALDQRQLDRDRAAESDQP